MKLSRRCLGGAVAPKIRRLWVILAPPYSIHQVVEFGLHLFLGSFINHYWAQLGKDIIPRTRPLRGEGLCWQNATRATSPKCVVRDICYSGWSREQVVALREGRGLNREARFLIEFRGQLGDLGPKFCYFLLNLWSKRVTWRGPQPSAGWVFRI